VVVTSRMAGQRESAGVHRVGRSVVILSNGSFARVTAGLGSGNRSAIFSGGSGSTWSTSTAPHADARPDRAGSAADLGIPTVGPSIPGSGARGLFDPSRPSSAAPRTARRVYRGECAGHRRPRPLLQGELGNHSNGVDVGYFHPNGRKPPDASSGPKLLFLGRLDPRNGLDQVLSAMPAGSGVSKAKLTIAGDGPLRPAYESRARPLGASVTFVDACTPSGRRSTPAPISTSAPPTRLRSNHAPRGHGLRHPGHRLGHLRLPRAGRRGKSLLVPPDDPGAWADAVIRLTRDPDRRAEMSAWGREKASQYSWRRLPRECSRSTGGRCDDPRARPGDLGRGDRGRDFPRMVRVRHVRTEQHPLWPRDRTRPREGR